MVIIRNGGVDTSRKQPQPHIPDAPEDVVARWCSLCGGEIYAGESYYEPDGRAVCQDCLPAFARSYFIGDLRVAMTPRFVP